MKDNKKLTPERERKAKALFEEMRKDQDDLLGKPEKWWHMPAFIIGFFIFAIFFIDACNRM